MFLESNFFVNTLGFLMILVLSIYIYSNYKLSYWKRRGVPSPHTHWFFGNFKDGVLFRTSVGHLLGKLYKEAENEPFIGIYIMHKPFLLLRDPGLIKQVLVKDFKSFQNRYFSSTRTKDVIGSTGLFSIDNPEWKYLRTKLSPAFSCGKQKKLFSMMMESSENMRNFLHSQFNQDENIKNIETKIVSTKYITDVISSFAYGVRTNSFQTNAEFFENVHQNLEPSFWRSLQLFSIFFFPWLRDCLNTSILGASTNYFRTLFWDVMKQREESGFKRGDSIDFLLEIKSERHRLDFEIPDDTLLAQPVIFCVAGVETSSVTMAFALLELAKHPALQKRLRKEIEDHLEEYGYTYEAIKGMKFLQQVISETLRLYPVVPVLDRVAGEDYKIPGTNVVLEKGTAVYVALYGLHEDPKYHPDPLKFDPDRFNEERKGEIIPCTYMPFGEGPRACIGSRVGMLQTSMGLATILRDYEVSLNPQYIYGLDPRAIFLQPLDGIKLDFRKVLGKKDLQ